jgi:hypothetical protein
LPDWSWIACVLAIDVAHVYSTLFRTYLDGAEMRAHRLRYYGIPALAYALGVGLHASSSQLFWRVLAYLALFHFVRQQVGWVALYRARSKRGASDRLLDDAAVYVATLYPVLVWHTRLRETKFAWFVSGDFVDLSWIATNLLPFARVLWALILGAFIGREVTRYVRTHTFALGKCVVVASTAACWYVGIAATNSDFDFTVTNVIVHGVPYIVLIWMYARARQRDASSTLGSQIAALGFTAFMGLLLVLAFAEEMAWDRWVWHDRPWLFGASAPDLSGSALTLLVPLLALPQITHYLLDGLLWRRRETARLPAQRAAIGLPERLATDP